MMILRFLGLCTVIGLIAGVWAGTWVIGVIAGFVVLCLFGEAVYEMNMAWDVSKFNKLKGKI
jgi:hypothetical protein